jgi:hypothetical protein
VVAVGQRGGAADPAVGAGGGHRLEHAHEIRFTALVAFEQLAEQIERGGGALWLAGASSETRSLVSRSGSTLRVTPAEVEPGLSVRRCLEAAARG